jgi:hypothetical protein
MKNSITVYFIPLIGSLILYWFLLRNKQSTTYKILSTIPMIQEQKNKLFGEIGVESLKVVISYIIINSLMRSRNA